MPIEGTQRRSDSIVDAFGVAEDEEHEEENKREEPGGEDKALVRNRGDQVYGSLVMKETPMAAFNSDSD